MRRRDFLRTAGGAATLGALPGCVADTGRAPPADPPAPFTLWTWVHGNRDYDAAEWGRRFGRLREAGFGAVLVGGGDIGLVSGAAHAEGLEYHRWFWTMNRNGDEWVQSNHPEWFTVSRNLESSLDQPPYVGYYKWVCPSRGPVRDYLGQRVGELAANPAVDGVHLDYVRHCDVILPRGLWDTYGLVQDTEHPEFDFCYCDVCREEFAALDGRDPLEIPDPPADEAWRRFRWDNRLQEPKITSRNRLKSNRTARSAILAGGGERVPSSLESGKSRIEWRELELNIRRWNRAPMAPHSKSLNTPSSPSR